MSSRRLIRKIVILKIVIEELALATKRLKGTKVHEAFRILIYISTFTQQWQIVFSIAGFRFVGVCDKLL